MEKMRCKLEHRPTSEIEKKQKIKKGRFTINGIEINIFGFHFIIAFQNLN